MIEAAQKNVRENVETGHQIELLEDHGAVALPVAECCTAQCGYLDITETDGTRSGVDQAVDHAQKSGLARPGATDDTNHLARRISMLTESTALWLPNCR